MFNNDRNLILNKDKILNELEEIYALEDINIIKDKIIDIDDNIQNTKCDKIGYLNIGSNGDTINAKYSYLHNELVQISETQTIERTKYYINRLIKALSEIKTSKVNDLNLNRWKEYDDILTDSLWVIDRRDTSGAHNGSYWGNFIQQIPTQLFRQKKKKGEWILDAFLGSGTSLIESRRLGRHGVGIELLENVANLAKENIEQEKNIYNTNTIVINDDSSTVDLKKELINYGINSVQFLIMHPPYHDIIKFSNDPRDLSNAKTVNDFISLMRKVIDNTYDILDKGRYMAIVIGDKYSRGEWIPLGFYCMQQALNKGYKLKSTIVKNFDETKGKQNQKELWRYRALAGGFYIFKHEYIFLFKK